MSRILYCLLLMVYTSCGTVRYFVVRHAEKETASAGSVMVTLNDPALSEAGKMRAGQLRDILKDQHIRFLYSTNTVRTIATAQPLQEWLGDVPIHLYNSKDSLGYFIHQLMNLKKGNVLVVGHSNTVDDIVNNLCGKKLIPGDLPDSEYDNLFVVTKKGKRWRFENRTFGTPTH